MKIVFLDAYTTFQKDIPSTEISKFGELTCYDRTSYSETISNAKDADIIITNKVVIDENILNSLPNLKYICVAATGFNIVDIDTARKRNIPVSNVKSYSTNSVAQFVFAHILNLVSRVAYQAETVKKGDWQKCSDFSYCGFPLFDLAEMTIGIVGFGNIARAVAEIAKGFKMNILVYKPTEISNKPKYVKQVNKDILFKESDIVSLHCPLNSDTEKIIDKKILSSMKKNSYLINTGRGGLINEDDLAFALNNGFIAGAGLDLLTQEPPANGSPLINAKNCYITPHVAWSSVNSRKRLVKGLAENIRTFIAGNPINVVN